MDQCLNSNSSVPFILGAGCGILSTLCYFYFKKMRPGTAAVEVGTRVSKLWQDKSHVGIQNGEKCKMVVVVRNDLKMGKGKIAAQVAHAAVHAYREGKAKAPEIVQMWEMEGQTKVCVKVDSEEELVSVASSSLEEGLIVSVIRDAGRTQIAPGTKTCCGLLGLNRVVDKTVGHLKLL